MTGRRRRRLGAKLALAYGWATGASLLALELLVLGGVFVVVNTHLAAFVVLGLRQDAVQAAPFFAGSAPQTAPLQRWLDAPTWYAGGSSDAGYVAAVGPDGRVIAATGGQPPPSGASLPALVPSAVAAGLEQLLRGFGGAALSYRLPNGNVYGLVPVPGAGGRPAAILIEAVTEPGRANLFWVDFYAKYVVAPTAAVLAIFGAVGGTVFGLLVTRAYVRRLAELAVVVGAWSRGDFGRFATPGDRDELGTLAEDLNQMARQLQALLEERQRLAAVEERGRISRDLHDRVKQQLFAASLQLGTAATALARRGEPVPPALAHAADTLAAAQTELVAVLEHLRPAELDGRGLAPALRNYARDWARRSGVPVDLHAEDVPLPAHVEEALFRIAQEGLANVLRHSGAGRATLRLHRDGGEAVLSLADDGRGFDTASLGGPGLGLRTMRERADRAGGRLTVASHPGGGTSLAATVPTAPPPPAASPTRPEVAT